MDAVEEALKVARQRQEKSEEELTELLNKEKQLVNEVDVYGEKLEKQMVLQKNMETQVAHAEAEFNRLNRRVIELEDDLETTENKYAMGMQKYDKAATSADESDRMAKVLENRASDDEKKMNTLADQLKDAQKMAEDADQKYEDASKRMNQCEAQLEVDGERADLSEFKIIELEEELKVVANNLKSLEVSEDKANQREEYYKVEIKKLTAKLKQCDTRAEFAERSVQKLQKEVDRLEDELVGEQEKFKAITEELDATFAEMSGY